MKNKKTERFLVKLTTGALCSVVLGLVYTLGEKTNEAVDEKYEWKHGISKDDRKPW